MITYSQNVDTAKVGILSSSNVVVPIDCLGIHIHTWPINQRNYLNGRIAAGNIGEYTIMLSTADALITAGCNIVTQNDLGTGIGAKVLSIAGAVLTLDTPNVTTFAGKTIEIYKAGLTESLGAVGSSPSALGYSWYRTHDGQWGQWYTHNPAPGVYCWTNPDAVYAQMVSEGRQILCTLLGTPKFASARPLEIGYNYGGRGHGAEPLNMQYWVDYCIAHATRYPLITHYEVWNEPDFTAVNSKVTTTSGSNIVTLAETLNVSATGASGANTITLSSGTSLLVEVGGAVIGTGIAANVTVNSKNGNVITLSANNTGTVSGAISFHSSYYFVTTNGGVMGAGIPIGAQVTSVASDRVTVTLTMNATASGTVAATFHSPSSGDFSGMPEKLSEMVRLASLAIKSVNPNAKVLSPPFPDMSGVPAKVANGVAVSSDGTTITVYKNTHNASVGSQVVLSNAGSFNTPAGTRDIVISSTTHNFTITRACTAGINRVCTLLYQTTVTDSMYRASSVGLSFSGNNGTGTTLMDWVDIFATHTYASNNLIFSQILLWRRYLAYLGKDTLEKWTTEFGVAFNANLTSVTVTAGSNTVTVAPTQTANSLVGFKLMDASGTLVGYISGNSGTTATLSSPALITLTGTFSFLSSAEIGYLANKNILQRLAAGFSKTFFYSWDSSTRGIVGNTSAITAVHDGAASVAGKTIVQVNGESPTGGTAYIHLATGETISV
jgi:hypothetical protein